MATVRTTMVKIACDNLEVMLSMHPHSVWKATDDDLIDELWGRLCPDMGQQDFRDAVKAMSTIPEIRDIPEEDKCGVLLYRSGERDDEPCILRRGHGGLHRCS